MGPDERVKPRLFQTLTRDTRPDYTGIKQSLHHLCLNELNEYIYTHNVITLGTWGAFLKEQNLTY